MSGNPLQVFDKVDPALRKQVESTAEFALTDGALSRKFKLLIAMALDAAEGASEGVKALAQMAIDAGATKEEIGEALRVAQYITGVGSVYTAARAFEKMF